MVCAVLPTLKFCCTCGAAFQFVSPAWFASITQLPAPMNDTVEPVIEHTDAAVASIVSATVSAEDAVAVTLYVGPPTVALPGAVEVNVMVWLPLATAKLCSACGAAL